MKKVTRTNFFWKIMISAGIGVIVLKFSHVYPAGTRWLNTPRGHMVIDIIWVALLVALIWYAPFFRNE